ncbi:hypothetical protein KR054_008492 [Drosophila jambulina]|nr:hypothetical protein KR054_008492 [Drosophila jambulina]
MLTVTINFVSQIVESVPAEERGPASAALQEYVNRGRELRQRGSVQEKFEHVKRLQQVFENLQGQLIPSSTEANVIGMSMLGLLGVASEFAKEDEKLHKKFVEGATKMKAKLTPATIARESELFAVMDELINSPKFYEHEPLIERFLTFKNRY